MPKKPANDDTTRPIFRKDDELFDDSLQKEIEEQKSKPVECLGRTFPNDAARREYYLARLKEHLQDPEFRNTPGFPQGTDEDILKLSDPPYYTACPNPFIVSYVQQYGEPYDASTTATCQPFAADVSEGKSDPVYNAHSYHTKVPYKAIMRYILHYTQPGQVILDGFCGTGMTGVAAQMCGDRSVVESLGYRVSNDGIISDSEVSEQGQQAWTPISKLGARHALLTDLSPAATFISHNYNTPVDVQLFERDAMHALNSIERECGWLFETVHSDGKTKGRIIYTIWSDVFVCPECASELVFWNHAVDQDHGKVRDEFPCPSCNAVVTKRRMEHAWATSVDELLGTPIRAAKQVPVRITYVVGGTRYDKVPDAADLSLLERVGSTPTRYWFPSDRMPEGGEARRNDDLGITHVHQFFTRRNRMYLAAALRHMSTPHLLWAVTSVVQRASKQHQIAITRIGGEKAGEGGATAGHRRGTLYVPSNQVEYNPFELLLERIKVIAKAHRVSIRDARTTLVSTASSTRLSLPPNSVDYVFVDPPFGGNIMYSELNFTWESILRVFSNPDDEAIENTKRGKSLFDYHNLMVQCFCEFYRVLKPGKWMTVEFHNSKNSVWNVIQDALQQAGFVVADVSVLDKQLKTHTQRTAAGSVNQDLAISAYKPNGGLEDRFKSVAGSVEGAWDFVRTHLRQLPPFVVRAGKMEPVAERQDFMLFDRMVAFHIKRVASVPISAAEFYAGLAQRFSERDGMYFLPEQAAEYDRKRASVGSAEQMELIARDEESAIRWLRQELKERPRTFQEVSPQFMQETRGWAKHETPVDLRVLLQQNFLCYDGQEEVPSQIHAYLSTNFKDLRGKPKDAPELRAKAKDRWYVPDPKKSGDLEKLRERELLKEFEGYRTNKTKQIKVFRVEAMRAGFKAAYDKKEYATIVEMAEKLPEAVLQEDDKLLMYYDVAVMRAGDRKAKTELF